MDFLRRIEDDVRNLGAEVKRKYPEVREAADKALITLKTMRESYVAEIMRGGENTPKIAKYRSADVIEPYILTCNHADANLKTAMLSLNGLQMLLNYEVIPPAEAPNILRVLSIQASSGRTEVQLKVLQIVLQLANSLAVEPTTTPLLSESNVCGMMMLSLQLCDPKGGNVSVTSTAFATARQLVALVMDSTSESLHDFNGNSASIEKIETDNIVGNVLSPGLVHSAILLVKDFSLFLRGISGEWLKGLTVSQSIALDLLHDVLNGWRHLFQTVPSFKSLLKSPVSQNLKPLLRSLREDYTLALKNGTTNPGALTTRVVRLARCLLLNYLQPDFVLEAEAIISLMVYTLQPERGISDMVPNISRQYYNSDDGNGTSKTSRADESGGHSGLIFRLTAKSVSTAGVTGANLRPGVAGSSFLALGHPGHYTAYGGSGGSGNTVAQSIASYVPAHPAGVCLEALLSFLLTVPLMERMAVNKEGEGALVVALTSLSVTVSSLLSEALSIDFNTRDFEITVRTSPLLQIIEGILSGAESNVESVSRSLHEYVISSFYVSSAEVLVLSFQLSEVIARLLMKTALASLIDSNISLKSNCLTVKSHYATGSTQCQNDDEKRVFISLSLLTGVFPPDASPPASLARAIQRAAVAICDRAFEGQLDACTTLLQRTEESGVIRRGLGVMTEWAVATGILGLHRPSDIIIATLCKFTVPRWHGQELMSLDTRPQPGSQPSNSTPVLSSNEIFRWRHVQASVRLLQVVHVLADAITDWDAVLDCFEQLTLFLSSSKSIFHEDVTPLELEKISNAIHRFKNYTIFLSDEALVRMMSSLVALSLNSLAVSATSTLSSTTSSNGANSSQLSGGAGVSMAGTGGVNALEKAIQRSVSNINGAISTGLQGGGPNAASPLSAGVNASLQYSVEGMSTASSSSALSCSYSLQAAVDIAKCNAYRIACIWQMVTSHLRMIASHKVSGTRGVAVAASHVLIRETLEFFRDPIMPPPYMVSRSPSPAVYSQPAKAFLLDDNGVDAIRIQSSSSPCLSDSIIYGGILQSSDAVFEPRCHLKEWLTEDNSAKSITRPQLSQQDLLASLKALAVVKYTDVRVDIIQGMLALLQGGGHAVSDDGWAVVIDLLASVPASMVTSEPNSSGAGGEDGFPTEEETDEESRMASTTSGTWPRASLLIAFACITLIVDDFLETLPVQVIKDLIIGLSVFSAQNFDVNISLTSVEMLWKVTDFIMTASRERGEEKGTTAILDVTMTRLLVLSTDSRPEVRNCATNTLFAAMSANAQLMSSAQWKATFDDIVFPLFARAEERSKLAMRSKEEAMAPELKKGVRMTVHHSRDTAHKQWSETRVIALRGLARLVRACTRNLLVEPWYHDTWQTALEVCVRAVQATSGDPEVSIAGSDALFAMLKTVATQSYKSKVRANRGMRVVGGALVDDAADRPPHQSTTTAAAASHGSGRAKSHSSNKVYEEPAEDMMSVLAAEDDVAFEVTAREALWRSSWVSVRAAVCFEEHFGTGCDLALNLCQQLKELYTGGIDGEFRYSENVRNLLEMVMVLARPRSGGTVAVNSNPRLRRAVTGDQQLHRGILALLKDIRPVDLLSLCCFVSALSELSFAVMSTQIVPWLANGTRSEALPIILLPVDGRLRAEAGTYLIQLLNGSCKLASDIQDAAVNPPSPPVIISGHAAMNICVNVIFTRFVNDICANLLNTRNSSASESENAVVPSSLTDATTNKIPISNGHISSNGTSSAGRVNEFLASIGKMLSFEGASPDKDPTRGRTSSASSSQCPLPTPLSISLNNQNTALFRKHLTIFGVQLHQLDPVPIPTMTAFSSDSSSSAKESLTPLKWLVFPAPAQSLVLLSTALRVCLPNISVGSTSDQLWSNILLSLSCSLCPWLFSEICNSGSTNVLDAESTDVKSVTTTIISSDPSISSLPEASSSLSTISETFLPLLACVEATSQHCFTHRLKDTAVNALVDVLTVVTKFSIIALSSILDLDLTQLSQLSYTDPNVWTRQQYMICHCNDVLISCKIQLIAICNGQDLPVSARRSALQSLMSITNELTETILVSNLSSQPPVTCQSSEQSSSLFLSHHQEAAHFLILNCAEYFTALLNAPKGVVHLLPPATHPPSLQRNKELNLTVLYHDWNALITRLQLGLLSAAPSQASPSTPSGHGYAHAAERGTAAEGGGGGGGVPVTHSSGQASSASGLSDAASSATTASDTEKEWQGHEELENKCHLLLLFPLALRLLKRCDSLTDITTSDSSLLRHVIFELLSAVNFDSLASSYRTCLSNVSKKDKIMEVLKTELASVRSAASLPF